MSNLIHKKNIVLLFTCIGRRVELIQAFRNSAFDSGINLTIIGVDTSTTAPAMVFCDRSFTICRINEDGYIPTLLQLCKDNNVNLLIPTIDTDLLILSENRLRFLEINTEVLVSDYEKIQICRDKRKTAEYFKLCGVNTPDTTDDVDLYAGGFPCFIKPRDGSSSINAFKINLHAELLERAKIVPDYIIQPFIRGNEYTVDVFCDFLGNPLYIIPRKRLVVRSGEVLVTEICHDEQIKQECNKIIKAFKPRGPLTIQLIRDERGVDHFIEINPRFGGGCPLSMKNGSDIPKTIMQLLSGMPEVEKSIEKSSKEMIFSRFDQSVITSNHKSIISVKAYNEVMPVIEHMGVQGIVFDLDDTLYSEKEYVRSGLDAVSRCLPLEQDDFQGLWNSFNHGNKPIDDVLHQKRIFSEELKNELLQKYRSHFPQIHLFNGAKEFLEVWKAGSPSHKLGLITDGRVEGQNNKIDSLSIRHFFDEIIITDELAGRTGNVMRFRKPNAIAFQIMRERLGINYSRLVYIGDNPNKDFSTPLSLGMHVIQFIPEDGVLQ